MQKKAVHRQEDEQFELETEAGTALAQYQRKGDTLVLIHTEVPPRVREQGIAGQLAVAAAEYARENGLKLVPACAYMASYFKKHPEHRDILSDT